MKHLKLYEDYNKPKIDNQKIFYHGSNKKFDVFDEEYQLDGWLGKGFYFTDDKKKAKDYGRYVKPVHLDIKNPFYVQGDSPSDAYTEINKQFNPDGILNDELSFLLKKNSYDGCIFNHWEQGYMYTCFYSNQIKPI